MVLNTVKTVGRTRSGLLGIVIALMAIGFSSCANALYEEAEALRFEATAQTRIPLAPKTPTVSPLGGPEGSGKVLLSWEAVPGTDSYDIYYSATVSPPPMPNGGTNLTGPTCTIEGLANWQDYYFWIIGKNKHGSSPLSIPPAVGGPGIRVTALTLNKAAATFLVGSQETLVASCVPANATFPTVTWTSSNASAATVSNGIVTGGSSAGSATITAEVADGPSATFTATNKIYAVNTPGPAGGFLFYDKGNYDGGWRYMEAASVDVSVGSSGKWCHWDWYATAIPGADGVVVGTGKANTDAILAVTGPGTYWARVCRDYAQSGYSDWFMPSKDEVQLMINHVPSMTSFGYWWIVSSSQYPPDRCWVNRQDNPGDSNWYAIWKNSATGDYKTRPARRF